jgi:hypothetical protein
MSIMSSKQDESNKLLNEILSQFRKANTMTEKAYTDKQITPIHPVNATALY